MSFYYELSKYYKYIFPTNLTTLEFLLNHFQNRDKILDIACGSGEYSIALAKNKYNVIGVDLENEMIIKAQNKAAESKINVKFELSNMLYLNESFDSSSFSGIFCIGNSLVHLDNIGEIYIALKNMHDLLQEDGNLIIQIINYDRILNYNIKELPTIKNDDVGIEFIREYSKENGKIAFNTTLNIKNEKRFKNTVYLLPITSFNLISILKKLEFKDITLYGGFDESDYNKDQSMFLVITCTK